MINKKGHKRKVKREEQNTQYSSIIPQIIQSFGNFLNNVKNPWLVIAVLLIICGGILIHELISIKSSYSEQNELLKKENQSRIEKKNQPSRYYDFFKLNP
jgi:nucleoside permease NupC